MNAKTSIPKDARCMCTEKHGRGYHRYTAKCLNDATKIVTVEARHGRIADEIILTAGLDYFDESYLVLMCSPCAAYAERSDGDCLKKAQRSAHKSDHQVRGSIKGEVGRICQSEGINSTAAGLGPSSLDPQGEPYIPDDELPK